jgi:hypothetical protein
MCASPDAFLDLCGARPGHRTLELGKCARVLEHELAARSRRIDRLLIQVQIDTAGPRGAKLFPIDRLASAPASSS